MPSSVYVYNFKYDGKLDRIKAKITSMIGRELKGKSFTPHLQGVSGVDARKIIFPSKKPNFDMELDFIKKIKSFFIISTSFWKSKKTIDPKI